MLSGAEGVADKPQESGVPDWQPNVTQSKPNERRSSLSPGTIESSLVHSKEWGPFCLSQRGAGARSHHSLHGRVFWMLWTAVGICSGCRWVPSEADQQNDAQNNLPDAVYWGERAQWGACCVSVVDFKVCFLLTFSNHKINCEREYHFFQNAEPPYSDAFEKKCVFMGWRG